MVALLFSKIKTKQMALLCKFLLGNAKNLLFHTHTPHTSHTHHTPNNTKQNIKHTRTHTHISYLKQTKKKNKMHTMITIPIKTNSN